MLQSESHVFVNDSLLILVFESAGRVLMLTRSAILRPDPRPFFEDEVCSLVVVVPDHGLLLLRAVDPFKHLNFSRSVFPCCRPSSWWIVGTK